MAYLTDRARHADDTCVPGDVKTAIRGAWGTEAMGMYDDCVKSEASNSQCTYDNIHRVNPCIFRRLLNSQNFRNVSQDFSFNTLTTCCGDQITINMMRCAKPRFSGNLQTSPKPAPEGDKPIDKEP